MPETRQASGEATCSVTPAVQTENLHSTGHIAIAGWNRECEVRESFLEGTTRSR